MEHAPFYEAIAASAAALFGIGAGVVGSRLVQLMERTAALRVEYGDLLNRSVTADDRLQMEWATRLRRDELADLHLIAASARRAVAWPLGVAVLVIVASLAPLADILLEDTMPLRVLLLGAFLVGALVWIAQLLDMAANLSAVTRRAFDEREKARKEATAQGLPYLVSGDEEKARKDAIEALDMLAAIFPDVMRRGLRDRLRLSLRRRRLRRERPPRV